MSNLYIGCQEIRGLLQISEAKAYEIIRQCNYELEQKGISTLKGKTFRLYFYKKYGLNSVWAKENEGGMQE